MGACSLTLSRFGEPVIYRYFPPSPTLTRSPTVTLTPTISLTPSITETPTITLTPEFSSTPTASYTPYLPISVIANFKATVTPNPSAVFSPLQFSRSINNFQAVNPTTIFQNPITRMFATYSYDGMLDGSQWTALWYRNGQLMFVDSAPWSAGSGGYGYSMWAPAPDEWLPGTYQVQIFVGIEWKVVGQFTVQGQPPTLTPTRTGTATWTPSITLTPSLSPTPSSTARPTWTPKPSDTKVPWPTITVIPTDTKMPWPTVTPTK